MGFQDHVENSFPRESIYQSIVRFLSQHLEQLDQKPPNLDSKKADKNFIEQGFCSINEITGHVCRDAGFDFEKLEKAERKNVIRDIRGQLENLVEFPNRCTLLFNNNLEIINDKKSKKNYYRLKRPLAEPTPRDYFQILRCFQLAATYLQHVIGFVPFLDNKLPALEKLENLTGGSLADNPFSTKGNEPFLVVKQKGYVKILTQNQFDEIYNAAKDAITKNKKVIFEYKSRKNDSAKSYTIDPVGFAVIIANGSTKLICGLKTIADAQQLLETRLFNLENIKNIRISDEDSCLNEKDRIEVYDIVEKNVGSYIEPLKNWCKAKIVIPDHMVDYVKNTQWLDYKQIVSTFKTETIIEVFAPRMTILSEVHSTRGDASIIFPPDLVKEYQAGLKNGETLLNERLKKYKEHTKSTGD